MIPIRIKVYLAVALCIIGLGYFGLRQYGNARVASVQTEMLSKGVSEAVEQRRTDLKADAQVAQNNRTALVPVRRSIEKARSYVPNPAPVHSGDCLSDVDPVRDGLLNDSIRAANAAIRAASRLPE